MRGRVSKQKCRVGDQRRKEGGRGKARGWWEENVYEKPFLVMEVKAKIAKGHSLKESRRPRVKGSSPWVTPALMVHPVVSSPMVC